MRMVEYVPPLRHSKRPGGWSRPHALGKQGHEGTAGTCATALPISAPSAELSGDPDAQASSSHC